MLISKGRVPASEPWHILEVAMGQAPDVLAIRLSKELKRIHEKSVQCFVPMRRNPAGDAEWIIEHVYVRGANGSLGLLARTAGIDCIRKELVSQQWIDDLAGHERAEVVQTVALGDFVRILTGPCARLCGHVTKALPPKFTVTIRMRTKSIRVVTISQNIQPVDCPPEHQVFFYQPALFA